DAYGITDVSCDDLVRGVIIGFVELHDCKPEIGGPSPWGWYVRNPKRAKRLRKPERRPNAVWFYPFARQNGSETMAIVRRIAQESDGREKGYIPHRDKHDRFVMATKLTGDPLHHASNQVFVETEQEMIQKLRTGNYHLRMTTGDKNAAPSLIAPDNIEII